MASDHLSQTQEASNIEVHYIHLPEVDSTITYAEERLDQISENHWLVVTADQQTAGQGTHQRTWFSPPHDNLYASFVLPWPKAYMSLLFHVSQVATVSIADALTDLGFFPKIKWINDIFLDGKKVGGVSCRNNTLTSSLTSSSALIISVGLNVNMSEELCNMVDQPATSLFVSSANKMSPVVVRDAIQKKLMHNLILLQREEFNPFWQTLDNYLLYKGEKVVVEVDRQRTVTGTFSGIDEKGAMLLTVGNKDLVKLTNGRMRLAKSLVDE